MTTRETIRCFVFESFYVDDPDTLSDRASLIERGIIDSTGVLEVIEFLESTFGIAVGDAEVVSANLDSIERITAFVERKQRAAA